MTRQGSHAPHAKLARKAASSLLGLLLLAGRGAALAADDGCAHPPEGQTLGMCLHAQEVRGDQRRHLRLAQFERTLSPAQRTALQRLLHAGEAFARQREQGETDLSSPAKAAAAVRARGAELDQLVQDLEGLEQARGKLAPAGLDADEVGHRLDAQLRALLRSPSASSDLLGYTTVRKADVLHAQQAWLQQREAWLAYAAARYPGFDQRAWWAVLTARRAAQLKTLSDHAQP